MNHEEPKVLVVGAGPSGLLMALNMKRAGFSNIRILDKKSGTTPWSKALVTSPRCMDLYDDLGVLEGILEAAGDQPETFEFSLGDNPPFMTLKNLGNPRVSNHTSLFVDQAGVEAVLYQSLLANELNVEWESPLTSLEVDTEKPGLIYRVKDGPPEWADYVIACDGKWSFVREKLDLPFPGRQTQAPTFRFDGKHPERLANMRPRAKVVSTDEFMGFCVSKPSGAQMAGATHADIQDSEGVATLFGEAFEVEEPRGQKFRIDKRIMDDFRYGRVFFVGDSAHCHSPAGGMGMNTSVQDAYNLSWKLAFYLTDRAPAYILDTYNLERRPVALDVLNLAHRPDKLLEMEGLVWAKKLVFYLMVNLIVLVCSWIPRVYDAVARTAYQLQVNYRSSCMSSEAGNYLPHVHVRVQGNSDFLKGFCHTCEWVLLVWQKGAAWVPPAEASQLKVVQISTEQNAPVCEYLGIGDSQIWLVRPDNYVAYVGLAEDQSDRDRLTHYLKTWVHQ